MHFYIFILYFQSDIAINSFEFRAVEFWWKIFLGYINLNSLLLSRYRHILFKKIYKFKISDINWLLSINIFILIHIFKSIGVFYRLAYFPRIFTARKHRVSYHPFANNKYVRSHDVDFIVRRYCVLAWLIVKYAPRDKYRHTIRSFDRETKILPTGIVDRTWKEIVTSRKMREKSRGRACLVLLTSR